MFDKRICVIGAGYWGKNHLKTLNSLNVLKGVVELDNVTLKSALNTYPKIKGHLRIEEALLEDYDGFTIATPAKTHFKIAKIIIEAKKHVLIEKPMTFSIEEADELVKLADQNKVNVMVGHVLLFHPAIMKIKNIIENGEIGDLQYIYSNRLNLGTVRTEENVFWSLAPHDIAIFQYLTGSIPREISARGSTFLQKGIPDLTLTELEYENGVKGHIFVSWLHPFKEHRLVVIGSEAMISFEDSLKERPLKLYSKKIDLKSGIPEKIDGPIKTIPFEKKMPLELELEYFISHLGEKRPEIANVNHGLEVIKVLVEASKQIVE
tara:strand:+ start:1498 stop:2460 length:963 start_codon:yes stop_codon:yes gene_type:complete